MKYSDLLKIAAGEQHGASEVSDAVKKILSPRPLEKPEDLEQIISSRFKYTGPGKWVKILNEAAKR